MFFSLDIVSLIVLKFPGDFREKDESYSLGVWPRPKSLVSFCGMEEVRWSVVADLFCFVSTSGVPPNEGFQSRALGSCACTTRNLVKNWGLGTCQAHYDF